MVNPTNPILFSKLTQAGVPDSLVSRLEQMLPTHDPVFTNALIAWVDQGDCRCLEAEGFSTRMLMHQMGMTYPNAVSVIIWLIDEPDEARDALGFGYDEIVDLGEDGEADA